MWELQGERLIGAAGSVAGAQHVFDRTLEYAKERTAFGRPIGHFQVIRHKFAEMATKIETARQMVYTTAWRFQNGEYPVREITMAKLYAARIAVEVADECIQIHGGNGYMKEYGIERVLARPAPEPDRRRQRRDHARGDRPLVRALASRDNQPPEKTKPAPHRSGARRAVCIPQVACVCRPALPRSVRIDVTSSICDDPVSAVNLQRDLRRPCREQPFTTPCTAEAVSIGSEGAQLGLSDDGARSGTATGPSSGSL